MNIHLNESNESLIYIAGSDKQWLELTRVCLKIHSRNLHAPI